MPSENATTVGSGRGGVTSAGVPGLHRGRRDGWQAPAGAAVRQIAVPASARSASASNRVAILSGMGVGMIQAATPLVFWWLDSAIVYALGLAVVAAIYIGFAVGDGRVRAMAGEASGAFAFGDAPAAAIPATPWLLVVGFVGHGLKDLWQH